jgi:hypothetical protein
MVNNISAPAATFRVLPRNDGGFGIELLIEGAEPVSVTGFATETAANDWIVNYQTRVEAARQPGARRSWARSRAR